MLCIKNHVKLFPKRFHRVPICQSDHVTTSRRLHRHSQFFLPENEGSQKNFILGERANGKMSISGGGVIFDGVFREKSIFWVKLVTKIAKKIIKTAF